MKTILATAITVAALVLGTGVAHASPGDMFDMDKYTDELSQHGMTVSPTDSLIVVQGLTACNGVREAGSRDAWVNSFSNGPTLMRGMAHDEAIITDAAIDAFCPQFKH
jgi:hypothetical protein